MSDSDIGRLPWYRPGAPARSGSAVASGGTDHEAATVTSPRDDDEPAAAAAAPDDVAATSPEAGVGGPGSPGPEPGGAASGEAADAEASADRPAGRSFPASWPSRAPSSKDLDPYPDDDRPSRRRPTISGRPFDPWIAAGDRMPPPGGYESPPSVAAPAQADAPRATPRRRAGGTTGKGPGRPRSAAAESKAHEAILDLFGERGWAGLSLDAVAQRAGLGKSSIYLRWSDKQDLLMDALRGIDYSVIHPPTGGRKRKPSVRTRLLYAAHRRIDQYGGRHGNAMYRLNIETRIYPEVFADLWQETVGQSVRDLASVLLDSVESGLEPTVEDTHDLIASVEGTAVYLAFLTGPSEKLSKQVLDRRIERMVDRHLRAIREQVASRSHAGRLPASGWPSRVQRPAE